MIEYFRKHMVWMMWVIVGLITVTFLFFGIYPSTDWGRSVAKVGDYVITADEFNRVYRNLYDNYKELLKDQMNDAFAKGLRNQALQELIVNRLLIDEAGREGIRVSDAELQAVIMKMPSFQREGRFDKQTYDRVLDRINMTPAQFEANQREYLLRQKLEQLVRDSVAVTDAELKPAYLQKNPKAKQGDFEKNVDGFRQSYLAEKQRDALTAYVRNLQNRTKVTINEKAMPS